MARPDAGGERPVEGYVADAGGVELALHAQRNGRSRVRHHGELVVRAVAAVDEGDVVAEHAGIA